MESFNNFSHRAQLLTTAAIASVATAGLFHAYNSHLRNVRRRQLDQDIKRSIASHDITRSLGKLETSSSTHDSALTNVDADLDYDEGLILEQLARNYAFFGEKGMEAIRNANIVIVGCGGVGSWAAVMLVRSYVRSLNQS